MLKGIVIVLTVITYVQAAPNAPRIIGGSPAEQGKYPFTASIQTVGSFKHGCGAAIIDAFHLISAGHCYYWAKPEAITAYIGSVYLNKNGTYYLISKLVTHPDFSLATLENDIAVYTLTSPLLLGGNIQPINLPIDINVNPGESATSVGWGTISYPDEDYPDQLQYLTSKIVDTEECSVALDGATIFPGNLCFGGDRGHGSCYGDSGSPLVYYSNNKSYVIGLVSQGKPCAIGVPDIYTDVTYFLPWILAQIVLQ